MNRFIIIAYVAGCLFGALIVWLIMRPGRHTTDQARIEQLLRDSLDHAGWAEKRDEQRDSINLAFKLKDDTLSYRLDSIMDRRSARLRLPHSQDADSVRARILRAVGIK
jgi:hypothetical protein